MLRSIVFSCLGIAALSVGCSSDQSPAAGGAGAAGASSSTGGAGGRGATASGGTSGASVSNAGSVSSARSVNNAGSAGGSSMGGSGAEGGADEAGAGGEASWQLRALTYNTALAPGFEALSAERAPQIVAALADAAKQLDLMCVQEFWTEADSASLRSATSAILPSSLRPAPKPGSGTCTSAELTTLGTCEATQCAAPPGGDLVGCLEEKCTTQVQAMSGACIGCLLNNVDNFANCAGDGTATSDPAIFGGDSDIGLLSRYPMLEQDTLPLDAYLQRGAVLYAKVEIPNLGPVHAFCTHLSSSLGIITYGGPDGSWNGEHSREVEQVVNFIAAKAADDAPVLLMGDLNMGLALNGNPGVLPDDFGLLLATGLADPYLDAGNPACSECSDNSFRGTGSVDDLIDHLMIKRFPAASASVARVFTAPITIGTVQTNLSDHYGLKLTLTSE